MAEYELLTDDMFLSLNVKTLQTPKKSRYNEIITTASNLNAHVFTFFINFQNVIKFEGQT